MLRISTDFVKILSLVVLLFSINLIFTGCGEKKLYYSDGRIKYEGGIKDNKENGKGKRYLSDGSLIYDGEWKDGKREGKGVEYYDNGKKKYEGGWKDDNYSGRGKEYYENGTLKYDGEWEDGLYCGTGILYLMNASKQYEGSWSSGKPHGQCSEYYENGKVKYEGKWQNGIRHGYGKFYNNSGGLIYEGNIYRNVFYIPPQYADAKPFSEGLAAVRGFDVKNGANHAQYGYINKKMQYIITPQFRNADIFSEGLALVSIPLERIKHPVTANLRTGFTDREGCFYTYPDIYPTGRFSENIAPYKKGMWEYGYFNRDGIIVHEFDLASFGKKTFSNPGTFSEGLASVKIGLDYGYIDKDINVVIKPMFYEAGTFSEGVAPVCNGIKWGYIDKTGGYVLEPQFDAAGNFSEGLAPVKIGSKWGYINKDGELVFKLQFDDAGCFSEGLAPARVGKYWGYIPNLSLDRDTLNRKLNAEYQPINAEKPNDDGWNIKLTHTGKNAFEEFDIQSDFTAGRYFLKYSDSETESVFVAPGVDYYVFSNKPWIAVLEHKNGSRIGKVQKAGWIEITGGENEGRLEVLSMAEGTELVFYLKKDSKDAIGFFDKNEMEKQIVIKPGQWSPWIVFPAEHKRFNGHFEGSAIVKTWNGEEYKTNTDKNIEIDNIFKVYNNDIKNLNAIFSFTVD